MDSPGHTAQYCTYTTMENESKDIISVVTVDKRQTNRNSVIMEKHAFIQTFDSLLENLNITEIVTDAHMQIAALMGKHEWTRGKCDHGPLDEATRDKELMVPGSAPHEALQRVMFNRRWLKDVVKYLTFWSTLELESFQNCILMYAGKSLPPVLTGCHLMEEALQKMRKEGRRFSETHDPQTIHLLDRSSPSCQRISCAAIVSSFVQPVVPPCPAAGCLHLSAEVAPPRR
ncbi:hypothetical protein ABVT39_021697 [Epinephelus coioides]